jgi:hypothetical protein
VRYQLLAHEEVARVIRVRGPRCSIFALAPFGELVVADVVLYSLALFVEFAALIHVRQHEPELRGHFRIPLRTSGVVVLASLPIAVLLLVIALGVRDGSYVSFRP